MIAVLFVPMQILGTFLSVKNPELLKKRLSTDEKEDDQKPVILFSALLFIASFVGIVPLLVLPVILVKRIKNEKKSLRKDLMVTKNIRPK